MKKQAGKQKAKERSSVSERSGQKSFLSPHNSVSKALNILCRLTHSSDFNLFTCSVHLAPVQLEKSPGGTQSGRPADRPARWGESRIH